MTSSIDRTTAFAAATALAAGALGAAAYFYTTGSAVTDEQSSETKALYEKWRAGPWFVRPEDVKGTAKVTELRIHPLKSCKDIAVQELHYTPLGVQYDREWCILDDRTHKVITQREEPSLVHVTPEIDQAAGILRVSFPTDPDCEPFEIPLKPTSEEKEMWALIDDAKVIESTNVHALVVPGADESLSRYLGRPVIVVALGPKLRKASLSGLYPDIEPSLQFQDDVPLHIVSKESVRAVASLMREVAGTKVDGDDHKNGELDFRRFRANVVLEGAGVPFAEDAWQGITFEPESGSRNDAALTVISRMVRCLVPSVDQDTGEVDKSSSYPLKVLLNRRNNVALEGNTQAKGCLGANCVPDGEGIIRIGDVVRVKKWLSV